MVEELRKVFLMFLLQVYSLFDRRLFQQMDIELSVKKLPVSIGQLWPLLYIADRLSLCLDSAVLCLFSDTAICWILGAVLSSLVLFLCSLPFPGFLLISVFRLPVSHLLIPPCSSCLSTVVISGDCVLSIPQLLDTMHPQHHCLLILTPVRFIPINGPFSLCKPHSPAFLPGWSPLTVCNCGFCPIEACIVRIFLLMFLRCSWRCN